MPKVDFSHCSGHPPHKNKRYVLANCIDYCLNVTQITNNTMEPIIYNLVEDMA